MSEIESAAIAVSEVAKTTRKAIDAIDKSRNFIYRVIGQPLETLAGGFDDRLKINRYKRLLELKDQVDEIHKRRGINATVIVDPRLGLEILRSASLEDNQSLQKRWAAMLANAMDPQRTKSVDRDFAGILTRLSALDVLVFQIVYDLELRTLRQIGHSGFAQNLDTVVGELIEKQGLEEDASLRSLEQLEHEGLIAFSDTSGAGIRSLARVSRNSDDPYSKRPGEFTIEVRRSGKAFMNAIVGD